MRCGKFGGGSGAQKSAINARECDRLRCAGLYLRLTIGSALFRTLDLSQVRERNAPELRRDQNQYHDAPPNSLFGGRFQAKVLENARAC